MASEIEQPSQQHYMELNSNQHVGFVEYSNEGRISTKNGYIVWPEDLTMSDLEARGKEREIYLRKKNKLQFAKEEVYEKAQQEVLGAIAQNHFEKHEDYAELKAFIDEQKALGNNLDIHNGVDITNSIVFNHQLPKIKRIELVEQIQTNGRLPFDHPVEIIDGKGPPNGIITENGVDRFQFGRDNLIGIDIIFNLAYPSANEMMHIFIPNDSFFKYWYYKYIEGFGGNAIHCDKPLADGLYHSLTFIRRGEKNDYLSGIYAVLIS